MRKLGLALASFIFSCTNGQQLTATTEDPVVSAPTTEATVLKSSSPLTPAEEAEAIERIQAAGGRVFLSLPGNVLVTSNIAEPEAAGFVRVTSRTETEDPIAARSLRMAASLLSPRLTAPSASRTSEPADAFDESEALELEKRSVEAELESTRDRILRGELEEELVGIDDRLQQIAIAPRSTTPAHSRGKYLRGTILVFFFFVESTGTGNENWTDAEFNDRLSSYTQLLFELSRVAPAAHQLTFMVRNFERTDARHRIHFEPTNGVPERKWIKEAMDNVGIGFHFEKFTRVRAFEKRLMEQHGAREATVVFVVRDQEPPFADPDDMERTAWPHAFFDYFAVMNSNYSDIGVTHELLHTFNAVDEYAASGDGCKARANLGHRRAEDEGSGNNSNANSENCSVFSGEQSCVMKHNSQSDDGVRHPVLCWHTRAQIGWRDTAAIGLQLTNLPVNTPTAYDPPLLAHINGVGVMGTETFAYAVSGTPSTGGRRCTTRSATGDRFTAVPGVFAGCSSSVFTSHAANGQPSDITISSPADEGRVFRFTVPYSVFTGDPCGDGVCAAGEETNTSCPADCFCGNGFCQSGETEANCPIDCDLGGFCGDGDCSPPETRNSCPEDCNPFFEP